MCRTPTASKFILFGLGVYLLLLICQSTLPPSLSYEIIKGTHIAEFLGARFLLKKTPTSSSGEISFNGTYGNPGIQFDPSISIIPNKLINLSSTSVEPIDQKYFTKQGTPKFQALILTQASSDPLCDTIGEPGNPTDPVFAYYDGVYWIHDPFYVSHVHPPEGELCQSVHMDVYFGHLFTISLSSSSFMIRR
jgi:hypothetical protein